MFEARGASFDPFCRRLQPFSPTRRRSGAGMAPAESFTRRHAARRKLNNPEKFTTGRFSDSSPRRLFRRCVNPSIHSKFFTMRDPEYWLALFNLSGWRASGDLQGRLFEW
jgi:hypothetical protein